MSPLLALSSWGTILLGYIVGALFIRPGSPSSELAGRGGGGGLDHVFDGARAIELDGATQSPPRTQYVAHWWKPVFSQDKPKETPAIPGVFGNLSAVVLHPKLRLHWVKAGFFARGVLVARGAPGGSNFVQRQVQAIDQPEPLQRCWLIKVADQGCTLNTCPALGRHILFSDVFAHLKEQGFSLRPVTTQSWYILCASSPSGHIIPASLDIAAVKSKDTLADLLVRKPFLASYLTFFRGSSTSACGVRSQRGTLSQTIWLFGL
eukprot:1160972-Pelagomonas_calceolata.AAC.2